MQLLIEEILKIKRILESLSSMYFYIKDTECRYVYITSNAEKFLGFSLTEVIYDNNFFNENLEEEKEILKGIKPQLQRVYYMKRRSDGKPVYMSIEKTPIKKNDQILGILCAARDVTDIYSEKILLLDLLFRRLTTTEKNYFLFKANDYDRKDIAEKLNTTVGTIDQYRYRILEKLKLTQEEFDVLKELYLKMIDDIYQKN